MIPSLWFEWELAGFPVQAKELFSSPEVKSLFLMLHLLKKVKGRKGEGAQPAGDWGQGVASVVPKLSGLAGCSRCGAEVIWAVFPLIHPTVPPGLDSFCPAAPFLLEKCFPALSKNENAGACQGALEDGLWWAAGAWSCSPWQTNNIQVNLQCHPVWSYEHEFVLMATTGTPKWAAGARKTTPPLWSA